MDSEASNQERCLALIVGQLRGVGRRTQPEFSQDVSSSRGTRWIQVILWDSLAPDEAVVVKGACSGTWHPETGSQPEFLGSCPPAHAHSYLTTALTDCQPILLVSPTPSPWMVARSVWTMQASLPGAPEGVPLGHMVVVAATLEVVETRDMGAAGTTVDLEVMDMDTDGLETIAAEARVVMTATREEITETIMTTELRHECT